MNNRFKACLMEFDEITQKLKEEKREFAYAVETFMENKGIPVKVLFFGDTFGLDIRVTWDNYKDVPRKIPLNVLSDFCEEFGCEFEYTNCDGNRYIFTFGKLDMGG